MERIAQEAEERHGVRAIVMPKDLARADAGLEVAEAVAGRGLEPGVLVNSAGFTQLTPFADSDETVMTALLRVNMEALTQLTRRLLPGMIERGSGRIVNLASNAAFQPGPGMACYYASKAYVLSFTIALHEELRGSGVTATALCPGPTESAFQSRADMEDAKIVTRNRLATSEEVAEWGWRAAQRGRSHAVYGARWRAFAFATRFMPRDLAARVVAGTNERD
jgi:short-subunit dehydrogenase